MSEPETRVSEFQIGCSGYSVEQARELGPTAQTLAQFFAASGNSPEQASAEHGVGSPLCHFGEFLAASPAAKRQATRPGDVNCTSQFDSVEFKPLQSVNCRLCTFAGWQA